MTRREAREQAFLLLFEKTFHDDPLEEMLEAALLARDFEVDGFARRVFDGVNEHKDEIEAAIETSIIGWKKNRLSRVSLAAMRVAVFEMLYEENIPVSVSINEAVELSKKYGSEDESAFVNGVLGGVAKKQEKKDE